MCGRDFIMWDELQCGIMISLSCGIYRDYNMGFQQKFNFKLVFYFHHYEQLCITSGQVLIQKADLGIIRSLNSKWMLYPAATLAVLPVSLAVSGRARISRAFQGRGF